ncbi:hypothetical protein MMC07_007526 [Pseudocyphellaria aurata]|nr:hypothetical protein [Pseudocyphellaria aurata]
MAMLYPSLFHPHCLPAAAALPSTVASYSTNRTTNSTPSSTTDLPRATTTTGATTVSKPPEHNSAVQPFTDTLNPPASTLPPPLNLPPPRQPDQSILSYYYALGKAYVSFYKFGMMSIYRNWKTTRQVRARIAAAPSPQERHGDDEALLRSGMLSRAEFLLILRTGRDIRKIPLFVLVYLVCGELTPLFVIALSGMVPRTLWIPKQVLAARNKAASRRAAAYRAKTANETERLGQILGVYPAFWDLVPAITSWFIHRRVAERLRLIDLDDFAIQQDGKGDGVQRLANLEELQLAAEMRGLDVVGRGEEELKATLAKWLRARKKGRSVKEMLYEGPDGWMGN